MTGAGSGSLAFVKGTGNSLIDISGTPTYYEPGRDPTITDLELDRAIERLRSPGQVFADTSVAQNLSGAFGVEFVMDSNRQSDVHDIVFTNPGGSPILQPGRAATSRWFVGVDYISATAERVLKGCVPLDYTVTYGQGETIRVAVTFAYADEESNTSVTPSSVQEADGSPAAFHSADFTIDGTTQSKEQSVTLNVSNLSRFERGSDEIAVDAVVAGAQVSLDLETILTEADQLELAYGGSGQTTTSTGITAVSGSLAYAAAGSTITTYDLAGLKTDTNAWQDAIAADPSTTERLTLVAADQTALGIS